MTTEMIDNSGIAEMIAEMTQNEQNMNRAPLAMGANVGLAIPAALMAPLPTNIPDAPVVSKGKTNREVITARDAWRHADFLCRNYVLNGLDNTLYNVYCANTTAKELWKSLEKKYKTEDAGVILHEIHVEGMQLSETFQVAAMIEKLSPSWKDFKNYLKHKRKEMNLEDLIVRLRIEEDNKFFEKKENQDWQYKSKANIVEHGQSSKGQSSKTKMKKFQNFGVKNKGNFKFTRRQMPNNRKAAGNPTGHWLEGGMDSALAGSQQRFGAMFGGLYWRLLAVVCDDNGEGWSPMVVGVDSLWFMVVLIWGGGSNGV
ncbi:hypothetical protein Acr_00g0068100 [Actinidia rufa]|uniref:Uncharacterized protein n=1 Tax=Actinidia rufa TaxID=165716 RepID=A0A7J0DQL8_9ERIC|nr:hypothetical protein Acr_00g0068100 [Actinidia rufa]